MKRIPSSISIMLKIGRLFRRHQIKRFGRVLDRHFKAFIQGYYNINFDLRNNGEERVIKLVEQLEPRVVFDVGANEGDWSKIVLKHHPKVEIHAFEIVPTTYQKLEKKFKDHPNMILNNFGLSNQDEEVSVSLSPYSSCSSTVYPIKNMKAHERWYSKQITCVARNSSSYVAECRIDRIDFLKVDVEGMDFQVLQGFADAIDKIRVIQFEYSHFCVGSRTYLYDFYMHLGKEDFVIGKIYPTHVEFSDYHFEKENFIACNYLAVKKSETQLIKLLSG